VRPGDRLTVLLLEVAGVVRRAVRVHGEPDHQDGTGPRRSVFGRPARVVLDEVRAQNNVRQATGYVRWSGLLLEPVLEATATDDPAELRAALVDTAATALAWLDHLDRRTTPTSTSTTSTTSTTTAAATTTSEGPRP
jgi:hypothetical protein